MCVCGGPTSIFFQGAPNPLAMALLASPVLFEPHYLSCVLSDGRIHKGIDIVCGDYGIVNAPFSGNLGGPVGRAVGDSIQYDGVKLYNKGIWDCPSQ